MYFIYIFEGKDKESSYPVRIIGTTSFNIELKEMFINTFDEENRVYQTEHFNDIDVIPERKVITLYKFI